MKFTWPWNVFSVRQNSVSFLAGGCDSSLDERAPIWYIISHILVLGIVDGEAKVRLTYVWEVQGETFSVSQREMRKVSPTRVSLNGSFVSLLFGKIESVWETSFLWNCDSIPQRVHKIYTECRIIHINIHTRGNNSLPSWWLGFSPRPAPARVYCPSTQHTWFLFCLLRLPIIVR